MPDLATPPAGAGLRITLVVDVVEIAGEDDVRPLGETLLSVAKTEIVLKRG